MTYIGLTFGKLTVTSEQFPDRVKSAIVVCRCVCGREGVERKLMTLRQALSHNRISSCAYCKPDVIARIKPIPIGTRFGKFITTSAISPDGFVDCACDCGHPVPRKHISVLKSCRYKTSIKHCTHRCTVSRKVPEYCLWQAMVSRCTRPSDPGYPNYGGRGIQVAQQWRLFDDFYHDIVREIGTRPSDEYSLDRINNDGNYEPGNVRWATTEQQQNNKRTNRFVYINNERFSAKQAARKNGIPYHLVQSRLRAGWCSEDAISIPAHGSQHYQFYFYNGKLRTVWDIASISGRSAKTLYRWLAKGVSLEEALSKGRSRKAA